MFAFDLWSLLERQFSEILNFYILQLGAYYVSFTFLSKLYMISAFHNCYMWALKSKCFSSSSMEILVWRGKTIHKILLIFSFISIQLFTFIADRKAKKKKKKQKITPHVQIKGSVNIKFRHRINLGSLSKTDVTRRT